MKMHIFCNDHGVVAVIVFLMKPNESKIIIATIT